MSPFPARQPLVSRTRRLSALYIPASCTAEIPPGSARATVEVWSETTPLVKVSSGGLGARGPWDRIVLVAHGDPISLPVSDGETCDPYLFNMAQAIRYGFRNKVAPTRRYLESLAGPLARHLELHYGGRTRQRERAGLSEARLAKALSYIDGHLFEDFEIDALAAAACLSPFHFQRMFKRSIGAAPQAFITRRRIAEASKLLGSTRLPVAEVARRVGYQNQAHFATLFRRVTGVTPSRYRSTAREGPAAT